ncbi:hypothetical protein PshuTeo1_54160 [Pseudomonas hunanensis]|nr:hypothetical protein PshuTeo1_54160 [Pseudomonas hunanensis]
MLVYPYGSGEACSMSSYKFSSEQRYAIFLVHGMKCYLCKKPLDLSSMVVDHVLPEHLLKKSRLLETTKTALGLSANFDINSFHNWLPACSDCNLKKAGLQFEPSLLIQVELQNLASKAEKARQLCEKVIGTRQVSVALHVLQHALQSGQKFEGRVQEQLSALALFAASQLYLPRGQPLRLTQSFRLVTTTVEDAASWGATHWSLGPREPGEPALVVLFREEEGECDHCGVESERVYHPINLEGGGDSVCSVCLSNFDWMDPVALGDLPTHCTQR